MGLFDFLRRLLFAQPPSRRPAATGGADFPVCRQARKPAPRLSRLRYRSTRKFSQTIETQMPPYRFAEFGGPRGGYLDLSLDGDAGRLAEFGLPEFHTPEQLAQWLGRPMGQVAWLIHRFFRNHRPESEKSAHYYYHWTRKRSGGWRLIEAPKRTLKDVQRDILSQILDKIPTHPNSHGFVRGRSIVTNARPHVGQRVLVKLDLENFYASVTFNRVVAIFRGVGYSREAAIWLARLTTSALPPNLPFPENDPMAILPFLPRHLPQGAPTSPALANLSAHSLDVRLSGMARCFAARYTRYADDLTFSGGENLIRGLPVFIPLVTQIIRSERFRVNRRKRKVIRNNRQQVTAGVVVNERPNVSRRRFDELKAILTNCIRHGPSSQNRFRHDDFASHLQGRIAHVTQLNPARGEKLRDLYRQIDWYS